MPVFRFEMRRGRVSLLVWSASIAFLLAVCVLMFPEMKSQMAAVSAIFANISVFAQMFGMDRLDFGTLIGFYGIECGNILGVCGALFAGLTGISMLAREEYEHTAEFLLTHPMTRLSAAGQKLLALTVQIMLLNLICLGASVLAVLLVGEPLPLRELLLLHAGHLFLQLEIAFLCFGLSAFLKRSSAGLGLGLAMLLYLCNLLRPISRSAAFLRYITPFAYTDAADVLQRKGLDGALLALGAAYAALFLCAGLIRYARKDIAA